MYQEKKKIITILICWLILSFIPLFQYAQNIDSLFDESLRLQTEGKFDRAIENLEKILPMLEARDSANRWRGFIHCSIANAHLTALRYTNAVASYKKGIAFYNQDSIIHEETYVYANFDLGIAFYNLFITEKSKNNEVFLDSMDLYFEKALNLREELLPYNHISYPLLFQEVAEIAYARGQYLKAQKNYFKAFYNIKNYHPAEAGFSQQTSKGLGLCIYLPPILNQ